MLIEMKFLFKNERIETEMARKANYEEKIADLEAKIEKKQAELKNLKATLSDLKAKKADDDYKELTEYMQANNLTAEEVLASLKG